MYNFTLKHFYLNLDLVSRNLLATTLKDLHIFYI